MENHEILERYRWLLQEAETINRQADRVMNIGVPAGMASTWPAVQTTKGGKSFFVPHGTNDPQAAASQKFDGYIQALREKAAEILKITDRFEKVIDMLHDDRDRVICRKYYGLGLTDEKIAEELNMDRGYVTVLRNKALLKIE